MRYFGSGFRGETPKFSKGPIALSYFYYILFLKSEKIII